MSTGQGTHPLGAAALLCAVLTTGSVAWSAEASLEAGSSAPAFQAQGLDGNPIDLRQAAAGSKYVLVHFWASWCDSCRSEFRRLRTIHDQYKDRGLTIIGVNIDTEKSEAVATARKESLGYAHAFDGKGWENAVAVQYHVHFIPEAFLLDKNLKIVAKGLEGTKLERQVAELFGAAPAQAVAARAASRPATAPAAPPAAAQQKGGRLSLYLAVGNSATEGRIVQIDGRGQTLGAVPLPGTPSGLAATSTDLYVTCPQGAQVFRVASNQEIAPLDVGALHSPAAIAACEKAGVLYVADNHLDKIVRLTLAGEPDGELQLNTPDLDLQDIALATNSDAVLMGSTKPQGVFPVDFAAGSLGRPLLPADGCVAADPSSGRWVAAQPDVIKVFDRGREVSTIRLPAGTRHYRSGRLAFGPGGELVVAVRSPQGVEIAQVDLDRQRVHVLCPWRGERLMALAVAPRWSWTDPTAPPVETAQPDETAAAEEMATANP